MTILFEELIEINDLGPLFRILRKEREFTLKSLSEGVISFSHLSKFEKGKTQISLQIFIQLLQRMNLTVDEVLYFNQTKTNQYRAFFQKIADAHIQQDLERLKKYLKIEKNLYQEKNIKFHKYNATMIGAVIKDIDSNFFISEDEIHELVDYILGCSFWTTYEISLFGNALSLFSEELLLILLKEIKKRIYDYKIMRKNLRDLIRLLQNGALIFLRKGKLDYAIKISNYLETVIERDQYFEMVRQLFIKGIITLGLGEEKKGLKQATKAIKTMEIFDEQLARNHRLELEKLKCYFKNKSTIYLHNET